MSLINTELINANTIDQGPLTTLSVSLVGTVLTEGTTALSVAYAFKTSESVEMRNAAFMHRMVSLRTDTAVVGPVALRSFETTYLAMRSSQPVAVETSNRIVVGETHRLSTEQPIEIEHNTVVGRKRSLLSESDCTVGVEVSPRALATLRCGEQIRVRGVVNPSAKRVFGVSASVVVRSDARVKVTCPMRTTSVCYVEVIGGVGEGDTRFAPDERKILVPAEDRKMMVV